jgi:hypothetical protein
MNMLEKIMGAVANGGLAASGAALFSGAFVVLVQVIIRYAELAPIWALPSSRAYFRDS